MRKPSLGNEIPVEDSADKTRLSDHSEGYVIAHSKDGVFLGHMLGLGFWSKLDPVGQEAAPCWPSMEEARDFVETWDLPAEEKEDFLSQLRFVAVTADVFNHTAASISACRKAGLDAWDPNGVFDPDQDLDPNISLH
ncbi:MULTISPECIES: hypothetical protein [Pseudomonas]|uniref:Uncharacterized protein n=1 Tax=Pseudomonas lutea TaxID=243924 RepID=A0A9X8MHB5_9PSED|nr:MULTISPECIES: hypothetical protein [Pseudomonas]SER39957.1 hypothetical protein SAMN05216409_11940 [Pseudomonas lutea]